MTVSNATLVPVPVPTAVHPLARPERSEADLLVDFFGGLKPSSRRTYRQRLMAFAKWLGCPLEMLPAALMGGGRGAANQLVLRYKGYLLRQGVAPSTINVSLSAIRSLVAVARMLGWVEWAVEIRLVRAQAYRDTAGPGLAVLRQLLAQAKEHPDPRTAARNTLIIRLTYDLALRCNELTTLELKHVELDADAAPIAVHILGKGESQRVRRTIPSASVTAMSAWLARRGSAPGSLIGLSNRGVAKVLDRLAAKAKLGRVRVHGLRHTSITVALVQNNGNIAKTMDHSRHVSPLTVMKYNDNRLNSAGEMTTAVSSAL